jgi:hypothetical protein
MSPPMPELVLSLFLSRLVLFLIFPSQSESMSDKARLDAYFQQRLSFVLVWPYISCLGLHLSILVIVLVFSLFLFLSWMRLAFFILVFVYERLHWL